jgi:hypothetical protein
MRFQSFLSRSACSLVLAGSALVACSAEPPEVPPEEIPRGGRGGSGNPGTGGSIAPGTGGTVSPGTGGTASPGTGGTTSPGTGGTTSPGTGGTTSPGSGGSAGVSVSCGMAAGVAADKLIDDLEDGDNTIGNGEGQPMPPARIGYWFTYNEKTDTPGSSCTQSPAPDPAGLLPFPPTAMPGNGSMYGAKTSGTGCTSTWGAGIGVDFNNCNMKSNAYDASAYTGISFWYKSKTPIRVLVGTKPNLPSAEGGACASDCYNHHGKNFAASTAGTAATITWAELSGTTQIGSPAADPQTYGTKRGFNPAQLLNLQVQVDQSGGASFEIWLDDLSFL